VVFCIGPPPEWFSLFLATCASNPTISWQIYGDQLNGFSAAPNVSLRAMTIHDLVFRLRDRLNINLPDNASESLSYKIVDFRPAIGVLFEQEIADFDFFGYGDIDVLYGDIRAFYTDAVLKHQVVSNHDRCVSGHLSLLRNEPAIRTAFKRAHHWRDAFSTTRNLRFDEDAFFSVFQYPPKIGPLRRTIMDLFDPVGRKLRNSNYFVEQYTTPLTPSPWHDGQLSHPQTWYWYKSKIFNDRDMFRHFPYLHFMNFKYNRYMSQFYGNKAPWAGLQTIMKVHASDLARGIRLDFEGIHTLSDEDLLYLESAQ